MYVNSLLSVSIHVWCLIIKQKSIYAFLKPFCTLVLFGTYIVQYSVYIVLCENNHIFTLNVSNSGKLGVAKKLYQKFG